jgi:hypothetical protein
MKKIALTFTLAFSLFACSDDYYESINVDPSNPSDVPQSFLVTNATTSLFDQMVNTNVNLNVFKLFAQYWTQTQYVDESNYDLNNRDIPGNHWNELYSDVLYDLQDAKGKIELDTDILDDQRANQWAIADILQVYAWQILVDTYGNVPYSEALLGLENTTPAYDDAATIYADLITRLTDDINMLNEGASGFGSDDIIYGDDISAWKKLAASLKLRLGVNLIDVNSSLATSTISSALSAGVFSSNADNFVIQYQGSAPYDNPISVDLIARNDFVPANTLTDYMNDLGDPRRAPYFDSNLTDDDGNVVYTGAEYAAGGSYTSFTHLNPWFYDPTMPGDLLDYSEVEFLLAEAAAKGIAGTGSAETHYNAGIMASMEYWGVSADDAAAYIASSNVAWGSAPGTAKEKVAKQFWLAMYARGFEGWSVYRRLDAPELNIAALSQLPVPVRYNYPVSEQTLNASNYDAAVAAMGGDGTDVKIFWDIH